MYRSLLDLPIERGTLACLVAFIVFLMLNGSAKARSSGTLVFAYAIIIGRFELGLRDEYASPSLAPGEFAGAWSGDGLDSGRLARFGRGSDRRRHVWRRNLRSPAGSGVRG